MTASFALRSSVPYLAVAHRGPRCDDYGGCHVLPAISDPTLPLAAPCSMFDLRRVDIGLHGVSCARAAQAPGMLHVGEVWAGIVLEAAGHVDVVVVRRSTPPRFCGCVVSRVEQVLKPGFPGSSTRGAHRPALSAYVRRHAGSGPDGLREQGR